MIYKLKYSTISDIGITDLIFYDEKKKIELVEFCKSNLISYLPSKDRKHAYKLIDNEFVITKLDRDLCLNPFDRLFEISTINKFQKVDHNEIRFITEGAKIKGVVHIIDYNNEFLQVEFYRAFYRFENNIRQILINNNLGNNDFISWVSYKSKTEINEQDKNYWKARYDNLMPIDLKKREFEEKKRLELNPFQSFYLRELILFGFDKEILDKNCINVDSISNLRNSIAHNKDFTSVVENSSGELIYHFKNLQKFINHSKDFFNAYDYVHELRNNN